MNTERIITQILEPLKERRDYVLNGKDILEQNAEILYKKKKLSKELIKQFKLRENASYLDLNSFISELVSRLNNTGDAIDSSSKIAIIKRCPKKDKDERPDSEQQWCLYTKDESRLLGRHPSKEKALGQERVIQIHKHIN